MWGFVPQPRDAPHTTFLSVWAASLMCPEPWDWRPAHFHHVWKHKPDPCQREPGIPILDQPLQGPWLLPSHQRLRRTEHSCLDSSSKGTLSVRCAPCTVLGVRRDPCPSLWMVTCTQNTLALREPGGDVTSQPQGHWAEIQKGSAGRSRTHVTGVEEKTTPSTPGPRGLSCQYCDLCSDGRPPSSATPPDQQKMSAVMCAQCSEGKAATQCPTGPY